ncbi:MAG: DUF3127 domain-containing protein [Bacteroidetes bacterium]|nr:DUF3127 domain-containing protein [Bacteroidota bacterium]
MNITGKLIEIYDTKQITEKFKKREFVVEYATNPEYPQYVKFELAQNNCDFLDGFSKGDVIDIQFDLKGRPWTNKEGEKTYFTSLQAWKIQKSEGGQQSADEYPEMRADSDSGNDLPF